MSRGRLVLKRGPGESFGIGSDAKHPAVTVKVLRVTSDGNVELEVDAPTSLRVLRTEIVDREPVDALTRRTRA